MWKDRALKLAIKEEMSTLRSLQAQRRMLLNGISEGDYTNPGEVAVTIKYVENKILQCEKRLGLWDNQK